MRHDTASNKHATLSTHLQRIITRKRSKCDTKKLFDAVDFIAFAGDQSSDPPNFPSFKSE